MVRFIHKGNTVNAVAKLELNKSIDSVFLNFSFTMNSGRNFHTVLSVIEILFPKAND